MSRPAQILPSLLAADMGRLADECRRCEAAGADGIHLDIMDGHFVPNLSMGPAICQMTRNTVKLPLSVHLMVMRPDFFAGPFLDAGADLLLIHVESRCEPRTVLEFIKERGCRAGVVLNPETPAEMARPFIPLCDEILLMTVHPGFGGQAFIPEVLPKIQEIRSMAPGIDISIDGGVTLETAAQCAAHGANVMIAGTSLFKSADMKKDIALMRSTVTGQLASCDAKGK